ncbi:phage scaffolding protein [Bacteroides sp.]|uniref:phage scaffolding protein n=1 Tax=Bacteroides sp. TaxID=29523 RepID=UPI002634767A|nr:phage scaffolding protein [Bacteroides sp.]MDD3039770.1 phage scaffolding protein [Bacteroides sp.]
MLTKEQLTAMGASEEVAIKILEANKTVMEGFVPKHRFDEITNELKEVKSQVKDRDTQIGELKKFEGTATQLQEKITALETANSEKEAKFKEQLLSEAKKNAVKVALLADEFSRPHDADMVMGLFDMSKITLDEAGKITGGFKEQSDKIKTEKSFLFNAVKAGDQNPFTGFKPIGNPPNNGTPPSPKTKEDQTIGFGMALAQSKLSMMGINPEKKE